MSKTKSVHSVWGDLNKWYDGLFDTDRELYFRIKGLLTLRRGITCGHTAPEPTCPCFHDGFIHCDAEEGYNHYQEWQQRLREEIEEIIEPTSDLKGDDLMHYDEGYADATDDILKLLT